MHPSLAIIVPVYNERDNIPLVVERVAQVVQGIDYELIFVDDDSPDGSYRVITQMAQAHPQVRGLLRIGRKGLASAVVEGFLSSHAPYLIVMDGDLQHDESCLPKMFALLEDGADMVVVGRNFTDTDKLGLSPLRQKLSNAGNALISWFIPHQVSDPLSGFFAIRADVFRRVVRHLSPKGFKILFDILSSAKNINIREITGTFRERAYGETKLSPNIILDMLSLLLDKSLGQFMPWRFAMFCVIGGFGVVIHISVLGMLYKGWDYSFWVSQTVATYITMLVNFMNNNYLTFRDRALKGERLFLGLLSFIGICTVGALVNVLIADALFNQSVPWWLSGLCGVFFGAIWNYSVSNHITWKRRV